MWTWGLAAWYARHGRHDLPWRATRDPWAVLVSEVMLQQTPVARVLPRWAAFIERWPAPEACAAASLEDVLRFWQGLGYPRRALALHRRAAAIAAGGWPADEAGLRALPGVGRYTARALLTLALGVACPPPADVDIRRVTARAALGVEPEAAAAGHIEAAITAGRPRHLSQRAYVLGLFDVGALHCRAQPPCAGCPLAATCRSRPRLRSRGHALAPRHGQPRYAGSFRQLRGVVLAAMLRPQEPRGIDELRAVLAGVVPSATPAGIAGALDSLIADGLLPAVRAPSYDG